MPAHPTDAKLAGISGVIFTGPPQDPEAHLRNITVARQWLDRSLGERHRDVGGDGRARRDGPAAATHEPFVHEGLVRARSSAAASSGEHSVGETTALVTEIEGSAWITGEHTFSTGRGRSVSGGMEFLSALSGPFRRPGAWTKSLGCLELRPHEGGGTRGDNRQPLRSERADDFDLTRRRSCHAQQSEVKKSGSHVTASSEELLPVRPERANLDLIAASWRRQHDGADCVRVVFRIAADQSDNRPDPF